MTHWIILCIVHYWLHDVVWFLRKNSIEFECSLSSPNSDLRSPRPTYYSWPRKLRRNYVEPGPKWPKRLEFSGRPKNVVLRPHYLKTDKTKNTDIWLVAGHWWGLHNRGRFLFISRNLVNFYCSRTTHIKLFTSYLKCCQYCHGHNSTSIPWKSIHLRRHSEK